MKYLVSLALVMSLVSVGFNWYVLSMQAQQKATNEATQLTICCPDDQVGEAIAVHVTGRADRITRAIDGVDADEDEAGGAGVGEGGWSSA